MITHSFVCSIPVPHKLPLGTAYTEIQRDVLGRNYILDALDSSIEAVNQGIAALKRTPTNAQIHAHVIEKKARISHYKPDTRTKI